MIRTIGSNDNERLGLDFERRSIPRKKENEWTVIFFLVWMYYLLYYKKLGL